MFCILLLQKSSALSSLTRSLLIIITAYLLKCRQKHLKIGNGEERTKKRDKQEWSSNRH